MNLKIGGSNVGKIMYNGQEFGGATKLEPGTILYVSETLKTGFENLHLLNTTKNWNNLNGINVSVYDDYFKTKYVDADIPSDDFKNFNIVKNYTKREGGTNYSDTITISASIVDGEYRLTVKTLYANKFIVKAI